MRLANWGDTSIAQDSNLYNVIISGGISTGFEIEAVKGSFARLFKTDKARVEKYFTGKPIVLERSLTREAAEKYKKAVFSTGVICYIMPVNTASVHTSEPQQAVNQPATTHRPETGTVKTESTGEDPWYDEKEDSPSARTFEEEFPEIRPQTPEPDTIPMDTFFNHIRGAFSYTFAGGGKWLIISGALFFTLVSNVPLFFHIPFTDIITVAIAGYMCAYMMKVLESSSMGERTFTDWPDISDLGDVIRPLGMFIAVIAMSLLPLIVYLYFVVPPDPDTLTMPGAGLTLRLFSAIISMYEFMLSVPEYILYGHEMMSVPIFVLLLLVGVCYAPMALMAVSVSNSLNPVPVIRSILKVPLSEYLISCGVIILSYIVKAIIVEILDLLYMPIAGDFLGKLIIIYALCLEMRILGLLYYTNKDRFEWF
ncbi:MAG: DUF4013 domain-containing protein [Nitrospirae bacterium]|nr:DUF4013 domain-containing protein [Nitrospirota bacterium]